MTGNAKLSQVLELAGVKRVLHVDDEFDPSVTKVMALAQSVSLDKAWKLLGNVVELPDSPPSNEDRGWRRLMKSISELDDCAKAADILVGGGATTQELQPLLALQQAFQESGSNFEQVPANDWPARKGELRSGDVVIFDEELKNRPNSGHDWMFDILRQETEDGGPQCHCLLLTNHANESEEDFRSKIRAMPNAILHGWHLMAKNALAVADLDERLANKIADVVNARTQVQLRQKITMIAETAIVNACNSLQQLEDEVLEQALVVSSYTEGAWPPETAERLVMAFFRGAFTDLAYSEDLLHTATRRVFGFLNLVDRGSSPSVKPLMITERYQTNVNTHGLPVSLGDIFVRKLDDDEFRLRKEWWTGKSEGQRKDPPRNQYYVLLAPPCDIAVRSNGRRFDDGRRGPRLLCRLERRPETLRPPA